MTIHLSITFLQELSPIPHSLSYDMAASLPVAYGSALLALKEVANVNEG